MTGSARLNTIYGGFTLLALMCVAWACFSPALTGPFIFDDFPNLENMRHLNDGVDVGSVGRYLASSHGSPDRPLAMLSFLIEDSAWPAYPADYKRNNLWLHLITGLLVCLLALRLERHLQVSPRAAQWIALSCSAAWLLNPMQLSATMLVVQRMNILSGIFTLLGLLAYLASLESKRASPMARTVLSGAFLATFGLLAYLCKENGILIAAYAAVLNGTLLRSLLATYPTACRRVLFAGTAGPIVLLALLAVAKLGWLQSLYETRDFTMAQRLLTQPRVLFDYVAQILVPRIGDQGIIHDDYLVSQTIFDPPITALALLSLTAFALTAFARRARSPVFAFAVLWFLAGHLLESSVLPLEIYFEHRNYLPMIGILFALAYLVATRSGVVGRYARPAFLVWLLACAALTRINAATWGDYGLQAQVWAKEHPGSARATQWFAAYQLQSGNPAAARATMLDGVSRVDSPTDLKLQIVLLDCVVSGVTAEQWQEAVSTMKVAPFNHLPSSLVTRYVKEMTGPACRGTLDLDMLLKFTNALMENPAYARVPETISAVHYDLAKIYVARRQLDLILHHLDLAYQNYPQPSIAREQAIHLLTAGIPEEALRYIDISDSTPQPWMKRWLADPARINRNLRRSAEAMRVDLQKHSDATRPVDRQQ